MAHTTTKNVECVRELHLNTVIALHSTVCSISIRIVCYWRALYMWYDVDSHSFRPLRSLLLTVKNSIRSFSCSNWCLGEKLCNKILWSNRFAVETLADWATFSGVLSGKVLMILMILFSWISLITVLQLLYIFKQSTFACNFTTSKTIHSHTVVCLCVFATWNFNTLVTSA